MAKYSKSSRISQETRDEAMRIARGIQRPGQTKEQTKLIAQGIQKGIDQYKKQYKAKVRELDKKSKKGAHSGPSGQENNPDSAPVVEYRQSPLPWLLLLLSWALFAIFYLFR